VCPVGCLSHLDVESDFAARQEGVVARIVVVPTEGQAVWENEEDYQSLSTI
jgi:hypothetical protein